MREPARATLLVSGRVQGVFYRATAMEEAQRLGLVGWVKNLPDGRVEVEAEGPRDVLEEFIAWCRQGPPSARVEDVIVKYSAARGEDRTFTIAR